MTGFVPLLLLACIVAFAIGWIDAASKRRFAITLWMLAPGGLFVVKSAIEQGWEGAAVSSLWALMMTICWGLSALLGLGLAIIGRELTGED